MNRTKIEYLDFSWNPTAGCSGFGCAVRANCWARRMAKRLGRFCDVCPSFVPHVHWSRLDEPLKVKKPSLIGVSFMGEFYDVGISEWARAEVYMRMEKARWHRFLVLTKQPQNIEDTVFPSNLWVGVSVNTQADVWRIECLKEKCVHVKVVSFEPLYDRLYVNLDGIDWIIIGAQTRPLVMPKREWVQSLIHEANKHDIPVFLKNNLGYVNPIQEFPKSEVE